MSVTVRGQAKVRWKPNYTIVADSPDGTSLDADGVLHDLIVTLTNTADGSPVVGRTIRLHTDPTGNTGDGKSKITNADGEATFRVSKSVTGAVIYTASLVPVPPTSDPTVEDDITISWGSGFYLFIFPSDSTSVSGSDFGPVDMALSSTDGVFTPVVGEPITVTPIGAIGATDGTGHLLFTLPDHPPGAVLYTLTVPSLASGTSSVPNTFTHTWT